MSPGHQRIAGLILLLCLAAPPVREALEALPTRHMLLQLPLLTLAGWAVSARRRPRPADPLTATAGVLFAVFNILFWMVPRSLDGALIDPSLEAWKFISLPFLAGVPLRLSWESVATVFRAYVKCQLVAMTAFLGWLYAASPVRLCNNYLDAPQRDLGEALLLTATALALAFGASAIMGSATRPSTTWGRAPLRQ